MHAERACEADDLLGNLKHSRYLVMGHETQRGSVEQIDKQYFTTDVVRRIKRHTVVKVQDENP